MSAASLEVWIDSDAVPLCRVGTLVHDRGQVQLRYDRDGLAQPLAFALDPDLSLGDAALSPKPAMGNFGIFLDSSLTVGARPC